jgi:hypothetical protein
MGVDLRGVWMVVWLGTLMVFMVMVDALLSAIVLQIQIWRVMYSEIGTGFQEHRTKKIKQEEVWFFYAPALLLLDT